jgi:hypothetical protein
LKWLKKQKRRSEVKEKLSLEEKIEEDKETKKRDRGQLNKQEKTSTSALKHLMEKKEEQVGEALKNAGQVNLGF